MANVDPSGLVAYAVDPGVYKYTHIGTAAGTTLISPWPALIGYIQLNNIAIGTLVVFDTNGTAGTAAGNVIGSIAITSVSGSAPLAPQLFPHLATKTGLVITQTANLDLTVAALP